VTEADYRRALLLTRIEAQRTVLGLESRLARHSFHPLGALLGFLGLDRKLAGAVAGSVRTLVGRQRPATLVSLAVAAGLLLIERLRRPRRSAA
jgi:hypothetical protein